MKATLGGGCFWCLEAAYQMIRGVKQVRPGYAGGTTKDPSYEAVCDGKTGHAEVVMIEFDEAQIRYEDILDVFWAIHDPTTLNQQGADVGTQYRSIIFYADESQKTTAEASRDAAQKLWDKPIVTEIQPLEAFYPAEDYHRNYFAQHPEQAYCQIVINPKLAKLRQLYHDLLIA
ncbi:MAG: peptide-methionine (S)-S-oxide reductase MsrA [Candidatus Saccharibacteria bacterium]